MLIADTVKQTGTDNSGDCSNDQDVTGVITAVSASGLTITDTDGNSVSFSGQPVSGSTRAGILLSATSNSLVQGNTTFQNSDYGINVVGSTSSNNVISGNLSYLNAEQWQRNANGIDVTGPNNSVIGNITHDNEDSGINIYPGADNYGFPRSSRRSFSVNVRSTFTTPSRARAVMGCAAIFRPRFSFK